MKAIVFASLFAASVFAEEIKPFDKFGKDNVTLEHSSRTSSRYTDSLRTSYGTRGDAKTITKELAIKCRSPKTPLAVEAFFVWKNNKGRYLLPAGEELIPIDGGEVSFSETGSSSKYKYVVLGVTDSDSNKVYGWIVRAIAPDGRIVGALASSESYLRAAEDPAILSRMLAGKEQ